MATSRKRKRRHTKCADRGRDSLFEELARLKTEAGRTVTRLYFDLGAQLRVARKHEAEYGSNIVEQLAKYLDFPGGENALHALRILAETYDCDFVDKEMSKPLANGHPLTLNHLIVLAGVASAADRRRLLKQARKHSLDVDELAELVRNEREKRETERREAEEAQMREWLGL